MVISTQTGIINIKLPEFLDNFACDISSRYGSLLLNGEKVYETTDKNDTVVNYYVNEVDSNQKINVSTNGGKISIDYPLQEEDEIQEEAEAANTAQ